MKRILVALDASPRAPHVLAAATSLARSAGAKLRLFRAVPVQADIPWDLLSNLPPGGVSELLARIARSELESLAEEVPAELLDGAETAVGTAWSMICSAARTYDADLIVIGSHGYGVLDHVLGTTASKVVNHASTSVLVVRAANAARPKR